MAINLAKMQEKKDRLEGKGARSNVFWKPSDGEQIIRILPLRSSGSTITLVIIEGF